MSEGMNPLAALLGPRGSCLGRRWHWRCDAAGERMAEAISQSHGLHPALARVMAGRGATVDTVASALEPRLRDLMPDPDGLTDMPAAVARLARAVRAGERVAIFGDYDVDGATSAALLAETLRALGLDPAIHIPDRLIEGYGPNAAAIAALADAGATLLVTVDCGTASHGPFAEAQRRGMDVVVLDHHQAPAELPAVTALVNPNRGDDLSGLGHLAACGVVFLTLVALLRALRREGVGPLPDLRASLDLVALGTVADVVPLHGLNRAFVRQGLAVMAARSRPGLAALADVARLRRAPTAHDLGFLLGPRINAGGRIGDAALGARLLLEDDPVEAQRLAARLDALNHERRSVEAIMLEEAEAAAESTLAAEPEAPMVMATGASWHPGVVGLIAARLRERHRRPAFALAVDGESGRATGSGRSVPGVDLGAAVRASVEAGLAEKGGGHAMAAGVTVPLEALSAWAAHMAAALGEPSARARAEDGLAIDATVIARGLTVELVEALDAAGPYGQGFPPPCLLMPSHRLVDVIPVGENHLRGRLVGDGASVPAIAFRAAGQPLGEAMRRLEGHAVHAVGQPQRDGWGSAPRAELRLADLAPAGGR